MVFELFSALVAALALVYAGVTRFVQGRLADRKEMESIQAESRRLNDEFQKAQKANDKKRMDRIMQEQMEFLPRMNAAMFKQFRPMIAIFAIFMAFMWVVGQIDPTTKDDIRLNLTDDGKGCDGIAGDGLFSGCFRIEGENRGKWTVDAKAYERGAEVASNETYFIYYPAPDNDTHTEAGKGSGMELATDRRLYYEGDTVQITARPSNMTKGEYFIIQISAPRALEADQVSAVISNGTYFRVDLPLTIPIIQVKSIYQPYWWFIFVSLLFSLSSGFVMGQINKLRGEGRQ